jgi:hypothetical protein
MLVRTPTVPREAFESGTGWQFKPEGACKGDVCIPLKEQPGERLDVRYMARTLGLPLAEDETRGLIAVGPESIGAHALTSAVAPDLRLPDLSGREFALSSLKGQKIVVYAWAPY